MSNSAPAASKRGLVTVHLCVRPFGYSSAASCSYIHTPRFRRRLRFNPSGLAPVAGCNVVHEPIIPEGRVGAETSITTLGGRDLQRDRVCVRAVPPRRLARELK